MVKAAKSLAQGMPHYRLRKSSAKPGTARDYIHRIHISEHPRRAMNIFALFWGDDCPGASLSEYIYLHGTY